MWSIEMVYSFPIINSLKFEFWVWRNQYWESYTPCKILNTRTELIALCEKILWKLKRKFKNKSTYLFI